MEYVKSGELAQAVEEFRAVLASDPGYSYAYFHGGQTLEKQGLFDQAREWYEKGIEEARRKSDQKALSELQGDARFAAMTGGMARVRRSRCEIPEEGTKLTDLPHRRTPGDKLKHAFTQACPTKSLPMWRFCWAVIHWKFI